MSVSLKYKREAIVSFRKVYISTLNNLKMFSKEFLLITFSLCLLTKDVIGHGRMEDPPARNYIWNVPGMNVPESQRNYNMNEVFCGGSGPLAASGDKCGVCGDPYNGEKNHETGGKYAPKIIGKSYTRGQTITIMINLTANHGGKHRFSICPRNSWDQHEKEECFKPLQLTNGQYEIEIPNSSGSGPKTFTAKLPDDIECANCIIRWQWDSSLTKEMYRNCADVSVGKK